MRQSRVFAAVIATSTAGVLPVFLLGGMAVQVRTDLAFPESSQGWIAFGYFGVSALASAAFGRLVERVGPVAAMRTSSIMSAIALLGASTATDMRTLLLWLAFGGLGNALAQPGSNALIVAGVKARRNGLAFGVKQSAIPAATLLAGLAVPTLALTVGWRWAFALAGVLAAAASLLVPGRVTTAALGPAEPVPVPVPGEPQPDHTATGRVDDGAPPVVAASSTGGPSTTGRRGRPEAAMSALIVLGLGAGLGSAMVNCLGAFLTSTAVHAGIGRGPAGVLLSVGSLIGLSSRLFGGWKADTMTRSHFRVVITMLLIGSIGLVLLSFGGVATVLAGTLIGFGAGWSWPGIFNLAVVSHNRQAPAAATGITQTGTYAGGAIGPVVFGYLVTGGSYRAGWLVFAVVALAAAAVIEVGRRMIETPTPTRPALAHTPA